jgi:4,5-DOPA dioxygenase extradiol
MPESIVEFPALFIGHGSPMNALEDNRFTAAWRSSVSTLPRPAAVLAISAHWYIGATAMTAMAQPRTIHDFFGFPDELFAVDYPAPGLPALAAEVAELAAPTWIGADADSWGLDHGTWSVLTHLYPDADVPVVQLSIDATKPAAYHVALGAALEPLRRRGVLVVGSGNVVHNLRQLDWGAPDHGAAWARAYDEAARSLLADRPGDVGALESHREHRQAAPTPEHLLPLYYIAGLAAAAGRPVTPFVEGCVMGSLSMTSYRVAGG